MKMVSIKRRARRENSMTMMMSKRIERGREKRSDYYILSTDAY